MTFAASFVIFIIVIGMIGLFWYALKSWGQSSKERVTASTADAVPLRPVPLVTDFHVHGDTASVVFSVPLGDSAAGAHLIDLLSANAVEYVREKVADGLPLDVVTQIAVSAMRGDTPEVISTVELPEAGELPEQASILARDPASHDPIAAVQAVAADRSTAPQSSRSDTLEPLTELIELPETLDAQLRAIGVDPAVMTLEDLVLGMLRVSGYNVEVGRSGFTVASAETADVFWISKQGASSLLVVVPHEVGSYPELDDTVLAEMSVGIAQLKPQQAILVSDKFGPYAMYERERRDNRLVFITRERLQAFVDSFGLG